MRYISTRGAGARSRLRECHARRARRRRRPLCARDAGRTLCRDEIAALAGLSYVDTAVAVMAPFVGDSLIARRSARAVRSSLWPLRSCRGHPARPARRAQLAARAVPRPDAGVQGCRAATARPAVRALPVDARHASDDRRRDLRRYRLGGDRRACGARQGRRLHAPPARPRLRRAAAADDDGARAQRPQYRDRRQLRRRAGAGEGDVRRPRLCRQVRAVGGQLDQLGAADGPDRLLFLRRRPPRRARAAGRLLGADRQFRRRVRRLCRGSGWGCRSRG